MHSSLGPGLNGQTTLKDLCQSGRARTIDSQTRVVLFLFVWRPRNKTHNHRAGGDGGTVLQVDVGRHCPAAPQHERSAAAAKRMRR